jgi:hypothetical protein
MSTDGSAPADSPSAQTGVAATTVAAGQAVASGQAVGSTAATEANRRPEFVEALIHEETITDKDHWFATNRRVNRFFVVNLQTVIARLDLKHTKSETYFRDAMAAIEAETQWKKQLPFEYVSSHTQIFPKNKQDAAQPRQSAKLFGHCATIIVALELAAKHLNSQVNVYDYMRILPAQCFVDQFNEERLKDLTEYHSRLSRDERILKFGVDAGDSTFSSACLPAIGQLKGRLLEQMTAGFCVTRFTANALVKHVNENYPAELHVGPVRSAGEDAIVEGLGYKNAAPDLRTPRTIPQSQLAACR